MFRRALGARVIVRVYLGVTLLFFIFLITPSNESHWLLFFFHPCLLRYFHAAIVRLLVIPIRFSARLFQSALRAPCEEIYYWKTPFPTSINFRTITLCILIYIFLSVLFLFCFFIFYNITIIVFKEQGLRFFFFTVTIRLLLSFCLSLLIVIHPNNRIARW